MGIDERHCRDLIRYEFDRLVTDHLLLQLNPNERNDLETVAASRGTTLPALIFREIGPRVARELLATPAAQQAIAEQRRIREERAAADRAVAQAERDKRDAEARARLAAQAEKDAKEKARALQR